MDSGIKPWLSIWVKPRETVRSIAETNPRYRFVALSFVYGFPWMLALSQSFSFGHSWSLAFIVILSLVLAIPVGALALSFLSLLLLWTGKLIKGQASYLQIRAAVSWSNVPNVVNIAIWALWVILFGSKVFDARFPVMQFQGAAQMIMLVTFLLEAVTGIWSLVIFVLGLSEVQKFSGWMALLNAILIVIILLVLGYIISMALSFGATV